MGLGGGEDSDGMRRATEEKGVEESKNSRAWD